MSSVESTLDAARREGDVAADEVVAALGDRAWAVNAMLGAVRTNTDPIPDAVPPAVRALVSSELPAWSDPIRIRRAQRFAEEHVLAITASLFCASLPTSYACADGARVLTASGRLQDDIDRRVNETARFVLDVISANGFDPGGSARVTCGKVRFIHAAVRRSLSERWSDGPSVPINQEDQLGTLLCFSVVVLRAMARLGVEVQSRDREDFVHLWATIGALLGVREDLLPRSYAEALDQLGSIERRQFAPSEDGRALMAALADGYDRHLGFLGGRKMALPLVRRLSGDRVGDLLGLPEERSSGSRFPKPPRSGAWGTKLMGAIAQAKLAGRTPTFPMPTSTGRSPLR
ncbi:MAG: DUF2236 domain-containing protein [Deltaproteobacteria bacterium]|nr:DUF2236 domain-containing protein [Deltaproteobacteria bacterium]